jgi:hypothetical protein
MTSLKRFLFLDIALGILAIFALVLQYLALGDIAKQGIDSALEWRVVGVSMIVLAVFVATTLVALVQVLRLGRNFQE